MFGAAAGLISLLIWTFYSSQAFFLGAEFVYVWCEENHRPIRPSSDAVRVVRQEVVVDHGHKVEQGSKIQKLKELKAKERAAEQAE
jgi:uncharacterized BrkB/YihY/UPF0761 family membrane protein